MARPSTANEQRFFADAVAAGEDERVEVVRGEHPARSRISPRTMRADSASTLRRSPSAGACLQVIDDVHLLDVGRRRDERRAAAVEREQRAGRLVDLGAVEEPGSRRGRRPRASRIAIGHLRYVRTPDPISRATFRGASALPRAGLGRKVDRDIAVGESLRPMGRASLAPLRPRARRPGRDLRGRRRAAGQRGARGQARARVPRRARPRPGEATARRRREPCARRRSPRRARPCRRSRATARSGATGTTGSARSRGSIARRDGADAPPALLEAARARYALYRWSAERVGPRRGAPRSRRAPRGSARASAPALAAAIRREAGDDRPAPEAPLRAARRRRGLRRAEPADDVQDPEPERRRSRRRSRTSPRRARRPRSRSARPAGRAPRASPASAPGRTTTTRASRSTSRTGSAGTSSSSRRRRGAPRRLALDLRPATLGGDALARPVDGRAGGSRARGAERSARRSASCSICPASRRVAALRARGSAAAHRGRRDGVAQATPSPRSSGETADASAPGATAPSGRAVGGDRPRPRRPRRCPSGACGPDARARSARRSSGGRRASAASSSTPATAGTTPARSARAACARRTSPSRSRSGSRRELRADGFEVVLTRKDDRYLALEERTAIANTARRRSVRLDPRERAPAPEPARRRDLLPERRRRPLRGAARRARERDRPRRAARRDVGRILTDLDAKASAGASRRLAAARPARAHEPASGRGSARCATSA